MLQVSVNRIFRQYPTANIYIFTKHPDKLAISCPKTIPIHPIIRKRWLNARFLPIPLRLIPMKFHKIIGEIELLIKLRCPEMANFSLKIIRKLKPNELDQPFDFFSLVKNSELVISSGGGFLNDIFLSTKKELFYTLYIAQQLGKKTAMFGQGMITQPFFCKFESEISIVL